MQQQLDRLSFDHATTTGKDPEPTLTYEPEYLYGYREGLIAKIRWAEENLSCFDAEHDFLYEVLSDAE